MDFSRQRFDEIVLGKLIELTDAVDLRGRIDAMWRGDKINSTEGRSVLHVALRQPPGAGVGGAAIEKTVMVERERMLGFVDAVRGGTITGSTKKPFKLVVNIGIGGSGPGPRDGRPGVGGIHRGRPEVRVRFQRRRLPPGRHPEDRRSGHHALHSGLEDVHHARDADQCPVGRAWLKGKLGEAAVPAHFAAVSTNSRAMDEFGVHPDYRFDMWDWVGGRYSLWSSIGVSLAIAVGRDNFLEILAGGHAMDEHFRTAPWQENLPVLMALAGIWNINFLGLPTLAVLPYDDRLKRFSAYLQQLEMESNGKSVMLDGKPVECATAAVIWGEPGDNAQHSFFQLLHQGTQRAALDFLVPAKSSCGDQDQQNLAIANCFAQAEAFMNGQSAEAVRADLERQNVPRNGWSLSFRKRSTRAAGRARSCCFRKPIPRRWASLSRSMSTRSSCRVSCGGSTLSISGVWSWERSWLSS